MVRKIPTFVKFSYKNKERLWVSVNKIEKGIIYGKLANNPISNGIKFNDLVKIRLSHVIEYIYQKYKQNNNTNTIFIISIIIDLSIDSGDLSMFRIIV